MWRRLEAIRTGRLLYRAEHPLVVQFTTAAPRVILQSIFFTLAGRVLLGRAGEQYAFIGCVAFAACVKTVIYICDIPMADKYADTYYRLQAGVLRPWEIYLCRALPFTLSGVVNSLLVLGITGPILGLTRESQTLLPLLPIYVLTACSSTAFGLAIAALAVARDADTLFGNLGSYLILAAAGVVMPMSSAPRWLSDAGDLIPVTHGLAAVRGHLSGQPVGGQVGLEIVAGMAWLIVAILLFSAQDRRARGAVLFRPAPRAVHRSPRLRISTSSRLP
jgi:ABC-2 type transport system permease protein